MKQYVRGFSTVLKMTSKCLKIADMKAAFTNPMTIAFLVVTGNLYPYWLYPY
jgi:hypothetical protein